MSKIVPYNGVYQYTVRKFHFNKCNELLFTIDNAEITILKNHILCYL